MSHENIDQIASRQKALGAFYTPSWLADSLVRWAIFSDDVRVLDPSFGGCAFLDSALRRLRALDVPDAPERIFGVDVDRRAWSFAKGLLAAGVPRRNLRHGSFFDPNLIAQTPTVETLVGNPPYVRHHALSDDDVTVAQDTLRALGQRLPRMASAWAYFAIISILHVAPGGRIALILPGALLHVRYAEAVLRLARESFARVRLIHVHERLFENTQEESVLLLGENRSTGSTGAIEYVRVSDKARVTDAIDERTGSPLMRAVSYKRDLLGEEICAAWERVAASSSSVALGDVASIRIGVVTGANDFFVRPVSDPILRLKDVKPVPIVSRNAWLHAPRLTRSRLNALSAYGERTQLAIIRGKGRPSSDLRAQLDLAERRGIAARHHCRKRSPWYLIDDTARPDMFLGYLNGSAPNLVRNDARATCTNAIHRIKVNDKEIVNLLVAGSHSSLFQLECEARGRHYGGGILKLEPSEAAQLRVPLATLDLRDLEGLGREDRRLIIDQELARRYRFQADDFVMIRRGVALLRMERERLRKSLV